MQPVTPPPPQGELIAVDKFPVIDTPAPDSSPNDFDDLDALLGESVTLRDTEREAKAARDRLRKRGAGSGRTPEEIAADEARVREWEMKHDWEATAAVALFEKHKCTCCGRAQTIFRQLMLKQQHRIFPATTRWQQIDEIADELSELPREIQVQKWETGMCTNCAEGFGFDFQQVAVSEWTGG